jgi:flagellar assembly protein FliH
MSMGANRFFSETDLLGVRLWEPGKLGAGFAPRKAAKNEKAEKPDAATGVNTDAVRGRAHEEGYNAGYAAGEIAAAAVALKLAKITESARNALSGQEQQIADSLLDLALDLARQIIRTDLRVKREDILQVVREAIDCLPQSTPNPQLILHPNDVDLVRAHIGDEITMGGWRVIEDHRVEPGGCRISAANCEVDATLSTRWKRVIAALGRDHSWIETEVEN